VRNLTVPDFQRSNTILAEEMDLLYLPEEFP